jgi:hypothetical protein
LNQLQVLLVTDDPGLRTGVSAALAERGAIADVEALAPDAAWSARTGRPDLIILDTQEPSQSGTTADLPAGRYPDSLVLRLWNEEEDPPEREVEHHSLSRECGYVRREGLDQIAPVIVALACFSRRKPRGAHSAATRP